MSAHKVYSFSTTDEKLQKTLDGWKDTKMFSAQMNVILNKYLKSK